MLPAGARTCAFVAPCHQACPACSLAPAPTIHSHTTPAHVTPAAPQVKTLTGKEIEIDIEPNDTVQRIKERVEEKEGIPPVQQRWVWEVAGSLAGYRAGLRHVVWPCSICQQLARRPCRRGSPAG
jgi:hypothetical protein